MKKIEFRMLNQMRLPNQKNSKAATPHTLARFRSRRLGLFPRSFFQGLTREMIWNNA